VTEQSKWDDLAKPAQRGYGQRFVLSFGLCLLHTFIIGMLCKFWLNLDSIYVLLIIILPPLVAGFVGIRFYPRLVNFFMNTGLADQNGPYTKILDDDGNYIGDANLSKDGRSNDPWDRHTAENEEHRDAR
jgi:hypothetical protein